MLVPHYGAGDKLREKRDERAEGHDVFLQFRVAFVYVDGVRHGLERVERYADGQREVERLQKGQEVDYEKVGVFEEPEHAYIRHHRRRDKAPRNFVVAFKLEMRDPVAVKIVEGDGKNHQKHVNRLAPAVKDKAYCEQNQIPPFQVLFRDQKVRDDTDGEKQE